jgi:hypothetical protein
MTKRTSGSGRTDPEQTDRRLTEDFNVRHEIHTSASRERGHRQDESYMKPVINFIVGVAFIIQMMASILAFLADFFVERFVIPAVFIRSRLRGVVRRLRRLKRTEDRDPTPIFARGKPRNHLWADYQDTLHEQREFDPTSGAFKPTAPRTSARDIYKQTLSFCGQPGPKQSGQG